MRASLKSFLGILGMCLLILIFSVVYADQPDDIENPENQSADRSFLCNAPAHIVSGVCCPGRMAYVVAGQCRECPAGKHKVGTQCCNVADTHIVNNQCSFCPSGKQRIGDQCCLTTQDYVVNGQCSFCPAGQQKVGNQCCATTHDFVVNGQCSVCPAGKKSISGQCCDTSDNFVVAGQCSECAAGKHKVGTQCCNTADNYVVNNQCSFCPSGQQKIGNQCCPTTHDFVVNGQCSVCPAGKKSISGKCCDNSDNFVVAGQCSECAAGKHKVGTQCCNTADNHIVNNQCSFCPAGQQKIGNQCCPTTHDFVVNGQCSVCPAGKKSISGKCCNNSDNFVVAGQCSECAAGKHKVGTQCCNTADNYVVNNQCSFCPAGQQKIGNQCCPTTHDFVVNGQCSVCPAGKKSISGKCCDNSDNFVVAGQCSECAAGKHKVGTQCCNVADKHVVNNQCSFCPAGQQKVGNQCCPTTHDFVVNGQCSVCPAGKKSISGKCCDNSDNFLVAGQCSECAAGKHKVGTQCCNTADNYVVNNQCSFCPAGQQKIGNQCCATTHDFVVNGRCSVCPAGKKSISGKCCDNSDNFIVAGQCSECAAGKHKVGTQCCNTADNYVVNNQCSFCPATKKRIESQCCALTDKFVIGGQCVQEKCLGYQVNLQFYFGYSKEVIRKFDDIVEKNSDTPSCLLKQLRTAYNKCKAHYTETDSMDMSKYYKHARWIDDCVVRALTDPLDSWERTGLKQFRSGTNYITNDMLNERTENRDHNTFYFDKNCTILRNQNVPEERACLAAKINYYGSPISLVLKGDQEEFSSSSTSIVVRFKLRPGVEEYVVWKASDKAPLLVYDPTHSGEISSYTQLFGEWTFGGKAEASLENMVSDAESPRTAWEDGYSALATLDTDMDGKIAGNELASLSLWFDSNRNAISEPGEVRSLVSEGIRTLYYRDKIKNEVTRDIKVELGFEREVEDQLVTGSTVDWYGVVGKTEAELVQRNNTLRALCQSGPAAEDSEEQSSEIASVVAPDPGFAGVWMWHSEDSDPEKVVGGVLAFESSESGKFKGTSVIEVSAEEGSAGFSSVISNFNIVGGLGGTEEGKTHNLIFKVKSNDGVRLESKATLSEDKNTLIGQTWALRGNGEEREVLTNYKWIANRYKE